jgi:5-hydroxyisourate hydrolase
MSQSPITTHILDTALGRPAAGVPISLRRWEGGAVELWGAMPAEGGFVELSAGLTDADGRVRTLLPPGALTSGLYQMRFDVAAYCAREGARGFYPEALVTFWVDRLDQHYHIPLLLSPFGYSTYRGS